MALCLIWLVACTTTQKTVAFQTLSAVQATVDSSLTAYADMVVSGKVDVATQVKVKAAKTRYEIAFKLALETAQGNLAAPAPGDIQKLADELSALLTVVLKK